MANDNCFVSIAGVKVAVTEEVPIINTIEFKVNSFIQGHHIYNSIQYPKTGEELKVVMEPSNKAHKYTVCVQKNDTFVGHLSKGGQADLQRQSSFSGR